MALTHSVFSKPATALASLVAVLCGTPMACSSGATAPANPDSNSRTGSNSDAGSVDSGAGLPLDSGNQTHTDSGQVSPPDSGTCENGPGAEATDQRSPELGTDL